MSDLKYNLADIETPALILDEQKMIKNIHRIMKVKDNNVQVRPHFKTHKSIEIAKKQLELGACGITVATVSEAEVLLHGGVRDILIAFPLVDKRKIERLLQWSNARIIFTVDSKEQSQIIEGIAIQLGVTPEVWIKVNSGLNRCGVEPGLEAVELIKEISTRNIVNATGIYTHAGHSYAATSQEMINKIAKEEAESVLQSAQLCEEAGFAILHKSVGSTPTFELASKYDGITEVRPGNAVFFDGIQVSLGVANLEEVALTVLTSVSSIKSNRFIIDGGSKALTTERGAHGNENIKGYGRLLLDPPLFVTRVSEEHGIIAMEVEHEEIVKNISLNKKLHVVPNHACPVVNLYDYYYVKKEEGIYEKVCIDGRGKSQ
ncbi:alanine racemase [Evansella sp. AB-rgal1]|uniref:alanine racemase n=1 Tax=Evansella sp. AB-rgal1 TaxID=3242696 RepID=UPI00359DEB4E